MAYTCPFLLKIWKFLKIHRAILGRIYYFLPRNGADLFSMWRITTPASESKFELRVSLNMMFFKLEDAIAITIWEEFTLYYPENWKYLDWVKMMDFYKYHTWSLWANLCYMWKYIWNKNLNFSKCIFSKKAQGIFLKPMACSN